MCGRYAFCIRSITDILHLKTPYNPGCLFKILTLKRYLHINQLEALKHFSL